MSHESRRLFVATAAFLGAGQLGCISEDTGAIMDAAALTAALEGATAGEEIRIGRARIEGSFVVPAGVAIVGDGELSVLVAAPGRPALTLLAGMPATSVGGLAVEVDGSVGVLARGAGGVALRSVTVRVTAGVGFGAEDLTALTMSDVTVDGAVTAESALGLASNPAPTEAPTYGVVLVRVASAQLDMLAVDGFGVAGVVAIDGDTVWNGGSSEGTRGTAVFINGGTAELNDLSLCGALRGGGLLPSYGAVFSGGADVHTNGMEVCDGEGYGVLQSEARGTHTDLVVRNMAEAGVWVQRSDAFSLVGAGSELSGNLIAGLFVAESSNVTVADATISNTRLGTRIGAGGVTMVGDGLQLVDTTSAVAIRDLRLTNNARVGLLLDVGMASTADVVLSGVTVTGEGAALGAVAQGSTVVPGWDAAVTREGATVTNDPAFAGVLDPVGVVSPTDLPAADALRSMGLASITGP